jgi:hypothetical protein
MATITPVTLTPVTERSGGTTLGQAVASFTPAGGGDNILATGTWLLISFNTAGTGATITFDSVELSSYGTDVNPTMVLSATDYQEMLIYVPDQRFLQPSGAGVPGSVGVTYSSVTTLTGKARIIA